MSGAESDSEQTVPGFDWDDELASELPGCVVLVGITKLGSAGDVVGLSQFYGTVLSVDRRTGILLELSGTRAGETYNLPPMTANLHQARPGIYRLRETGEEVEDPDFTTSWSVQQPVKS